MEKQHLHQDTAAGSATPATGSDFFNQFFSGALERAGMTRNDLGSQAGQEGNDNPSQSISSQIFKQNSNSASDQSINTNIAADGHGLDCGSDPGPSAEQLQEQADQEQQQQQQHSGSSPNSDRSLRQSRFDSDDPELLELTRALSEATTVNPSQSTSNQPSTSAHPHSTFSPTSNSFSRSVSSSQPPSRSSGFKDHSYFAHQRGGGLGTPTGERTQLGGSLKGTPSASMTNSLPSLRDASYFNQSANVSGDSMANLTPVMDKDGLGWPGELLGAQSSLFK